MSDNFTNAEVSPKIQHTIYTNNTRFSSIIYYNNSEPIFHDKINS